MDTRSHFGTLVEPRSVPADRLFHVSEELYQGLVDGGLIPEGVTLADGLLVRESASAGEWAERLYRMPLEVYEEISRGGPVGQADEVELLDGLLVTKMNRGLPHFVATMLAMKSLERILPDGWFVSKEDPVALPSGPSGYPSMSEPDATVIRGEIRDYLTRRPGPPDLALVVKVSDSSLHEDRAKLARYAWENVPVAWIVDLNARRVEEHTRPSGPAEAPGYREVAFHEPGQEIPVTLDGREAGRASVDELLP
ncbi:MAG: Uma2 family endonuclease [Isosphaeraceae bacterium]